ncbi:PREDICTED: serine/threonine-kinase [Prunus dulcis]|uniref:PREDICTED: serine/threonine-kinase n=1 Tax=Prunus dulcis TaxID=3755 RepID=A0A5E4G343_PRUDU|nr:PREDICTED: serine/threonine-kinase [Prunus dulcis]
MEMAMVEARGPFYKFSGPRKDSSKFKRRKKGKKKSMNSDSFGARPLFPNTPTFDRDDGIIRFPNSIVNNIHLFPFVFWKLHNPLGQIFPPPHSIENLLDLPPPPRIENLLDFPLPNLSLPRLSYYLCGVNRLRHWPEYLDHEGNNQIQIHHPRQIRENVANISVSAQWMLLLTSLCLEIVSAVFEQVSSPSRPHFGLIAMVLAILALLTCIAELFLKARKERVRLVRRRRMLPLFYHPPPRNRLFGTFSDVFGLLGVFFQMAFSIVHYAYLSKHVDNPIKVCFWPVLLILCVAGSILIRNRRNTEDNHDTGEHF